MIPLLENFRLEDCDEIGGLKKKNPRRHRSVRRPVLSWGLL
jgi:hypothetical protein